MSSIRKKKKPATVLPAENQVWVNPPITPMPEYTEAMGDEFRKNVKAAIAKSEAKKKKPRKKRTPKKEK